MSASACISNSTPNTFHKDGFSIKIWRITVWDSFFLYCFLKRCTTVTIYNKCQQLSLVQQNNTQIRHQSREGIEKERCLYCIEAEAPFKIATKENYVEMSTSQSLWVNQVEYWRRIYLSKRRRPLARVVYAGGRYRRKFDASKARRAARSKICCRRRVGAKRVDPTEVNWAIRSRGENPRGSVMLGLGRWRAERRAVKN